MTGNPTESGGSLAGHAMPAAVWIGAQGTPTRLVLCRHGQSESNLRRRYSGRADVALTDLGAQQAKALAQRFAGLDDVVAVVSSPLSRAVDTAAPIAAAVGVAPRVNEALIEVDFGAWEGLTFTEAAQRDPERHTRWLTDSAASPPGGESFDAVARRVGRVQDELVASFAGGTVIVVSHVTPIKSLLRLALDAGMSLMYRLHLDLAAVSVVDFYPDGNASVLLVNDTSHLR